MPNDPKPISVQAKIRLSDILSQPAFVGPVILASCLGAFGVYVALLVRGLDKWSLWFFFPYREVGPGDVAVASLLVFALVRVAVMHLLRGAVIDRRRTGPSYGPSPWLAIFITHGTFGIQLWGAVVGVATRRQESSALPTTNPLPIAVAVVLTTIYHGSILIVAAICFAPLAAILMLLLSSIGPLGCLGDSLKCEGLVSDLGGFIASVVRVIGAAIFWLWLSDIWLGIGRVAAMRTTLRRIEFGLIRHREPVASVTPGIDILHLTDVHCVENEHASRAETFGEKPFGNVVLNARFEELHDVMEQCDTFVLTGDLTDTGAWGEWDALQSIVASWSSVKRQKAFVIPGNHDINFVTRMGGIFTSRDTSQLHGRFMRQANYALFAQQFIKPGDEFASMTNFDEFQMYPVQDWFDRTREEMQNYLDAMRVGEAPRTPTNVWRWQVPISVRRLSKGGLRYALIGIDTSNWGWTGLSNALGTDSGNLHKLATKCAVTLAGEGYLPIIVGHHAMVPIYERGQRIGTGGCCDAGVEAVKVAASSQLYGDIWFENLLREVPSPGFVYLHGHRHVARCIGTEVVQSRRAYLLGAPSILFGDEWDGKATKVASRHRVSLLSSRLFVATEDVQSRMGY